MSKSTAVFSMILIIAVVLTFFLPRNDSNISDKSIAVSKVLAQNRDDGGDFLSQAFNVPGELPFYISFGEEFYERDFYTDIESNIISGYYSKPQKVYLDCEYDNLYYTTDGSLPDKNAEKYDNSKGIDVDESTFILVSAENNGEYSDPLYFSYVILKDRTDYKYAYGYNSLDENEKYIYELIYNNAKEFNRNIAIGNRGITYSKIQKILMCVNYDNPLMFQIPLAIINWSGTADNVTKIVLMEDFTSQECEYYRKKTEECADEILACADGSFSLMEYIDTIHYQLLSNAYYSADYEDSDYEAFGIMVKGKGVCESYSRAFQYICQRIGLQCILIVGDCEGEGHMWNMLQIEGDWYHIDLTWDDGDNGEIYYDYFNINDNLIIAYGNRTISPLIDDRLITRKILSDVNYYPIPKADGNKYSYTNYILGKV